MPQPFTEPVDRAVAHADSAAMQDLSQPALDAAAAAIRAGDRRALARGITLVESMRADHRVAAEGLLGRLLPATGGAVRAGITGTPGVGKSTFIEALGRLLTDRGLTVAVLAVDPSSGRSGGSILGDKTRMQTLARDPAAFIRPSPAAGTLGGVARRSRETLLLCEAAGFDVILVETVGVGQSEVAVADLVDSFLLLLSPAGGDELQGIKRGIMELADLVVVTKSDGDLKPAAGRAAADCRSALQLLRPATPGWTVPVLAVSALERTGLEAVWQALGSHRAAMGEAGLAARRASQAKAWLWSEIRDSLIDDFRRRPGIAGLLADLERDVAQGRLSPSAAARQLLAPGPGCQ